MASKTEGGDDTAAFKAMESKLATCDAELVRKDAMLKTQGERVKKRTSQRDKAMESVKTLNVDLKAAEAELRAAMD